MNLGLSIATPLTQAVRSPVPTGQDKPGCPGGTDLPSLDSPPRTPRRGMNWPVGQLQGQGSRAGNAGKRRGGGLTGSGDTAPQLSSTTLSNTNNIAGSPPPTARAPASLPSRSYPGAPGHPSRLRLPRRHSGPTNPSSGGERERTLVRQIRGDGPGRGARDPSQAKHAQQAAALVNPLHTCKQ